MRTHTCDIVDTQCALTKSVPTSLYIAAQCVFGASRRISRIDVSLFNALHQLQQLEIWNNCITTLEVGTFNGLHALQEPAPTKCLCVRVFVLHVPESAF